MRATIYIFLPGTLALSHVLNEAATGALHHTRLLDDGLFPLGDYEILGAYEEGEEDVVRIRKRANDDCETDCLNYSGWEEDEQMHCNGENAGDESTTIDASPDERRSITNNSEHTHRLRKRAGRKSSEK